MYFREIFSILVFLMGMFYLMWRSHQLALMHVPSAMFITNI